MMKARLYAPGPVSVPAQVLEAMSRPLIHHRTPEFKKLFGEVRAKLAQVACVPYGNILILSGSGTAAFEAGLLAAVPRAEKVLGIGGGKFAERWIDMAHAFGYDVKPLPVPWGETVNVDAVREHVSAHKDAFAITLVHSETSTGTLHDIASIAAAVREIAPEMRILVDCVTSLGVAELRPLEWQLDGVFAGSQKGLMTPPGLGFAWLSDRVWQQGSEHQNSEHQNSEHQNSEHQNSEHVSRYYLDLHKENAKQAKGETAYTPAVSLLQGLNVALDMILAEGLEATWARLKRNNQVVLEGASALGCTPFSERPSPAVAALRAPEGVAAPDIVAGFVTRNVRIAGGHDDAKPVLFRPSIMGDTDTYDALTIVMVLEDVLRDLGHDVAYGAGVAAASRFLHDGASVPA